MIKKRPYQGDFVGFVDKQANTYQIMLGTLWTLV